MSRPKALTDPEQITLVIERATKLKARELAFTNGISVGRLFSFLIEEACGFTPNTTTPPTHEQQNHA